MRICYKTFLFSIVYGYYWQVASKSRVVHLFWFASVASWFLNRPISSGAAVQPLYVHQSLLIDRTTAPLLLGCDEHIARARLQLWAPRIWTRTVSRLYERWLVLPN